MASFQFPVASGRKKPVQVFACPAESWKERAPRPARVRLSSLVNRAANQSFGY